MFPEYRPNEIEPRWQRFWEEAGLYRATETGAKPKYYCLDYFPYPSGEGLHVGHCRNYIPTDVISRFKRMRGFNVLHPADVPLGVFASGGLDSSLLAVLAAEVVGASRLHTFAVGFPDRAYDERRVAARLAATLGMPHASV